MVMLEPMVKQAVKEPTSLAVSGSRTRLFPPLVPDSLGAKARTEAMVEMVAVAASAPHREAAFAGAREIIDEIKSRAPIWKKEEGEWVRGATPQPRP